LVEVLDILELAYTKQEQGLGDNSPKPAVHADSRVHSGQLHTVGLPCRDFAMRTRMRALPAWPSITAVGPVASILLPED
jgi:hypothetical protein